MANASSAFLLFHGQSLPPVICAIRALTRPRLTPYDGQTRTYMLRKRPFTRVSVMALIVSCVAYDRRTVYVLDDGTDVITLIQSRPESREGQGLGTGEYDDGLAIGTLVRVTAVLCADARQPEKRLLRCESDAVDVVEDRAEEIAHIRTCSRLNAEDYAQPFDAQSLDVSHTSPEHSAAVSGSFFQSESLTSERFVFSAVSGLPLERSSGMFDRNPYDITQSVASTSSLQPVSVMAPTPVSNTFSASVGSERAALGPVQKLSRSECTALTFRLYLKEYLDAVCSQYHSDHVSSLTSSADTGPVSELMTYQELLEYQPSFSIKELRRVPHLRLLARRVTRQVQRLRDQSSKLHGGVQSGPSKVGEAVNVKIRRLYSHTIRQLHKEGSIVITQLPSPDPTKHPFAIVKNKVNGEHVYRLDKRLRLPDDPDDLLSSDEESPGSASPRTSAELFTPVTQSLLRPVLLRVLAKLAIDCAYSRMKRKKSRTEDVVRALHALDFGELMFRYCPSQTVEELLEHMQTQGEVERLGPGDLDEDCWVIA